MESLRGLKKDSPPVFILGAALTGALVVVTLTLLNLPNTSITVPIVTAFAVALWLNAWRISRQKNRSTS